MVFRSRKAATGVFLALVGGVLVSSGVAAAGHPPPTPADISVFKSGDGYVFKTADGLSIYTFGGDAQGRSNCVDRCAQAWPPVPASAEAKPVADWTPIDRVGGARQWAYKGRPVYTYAKDTPSATTGDGVGGAWALVKP